MNESDDLKKIAEQLSQPSTPTTETAWTNEFVWNQSLLIIGFGVLVLAAIVFMMSKGMKAVDVLRVCALPLTIIAAVYLIVVGYSKDQIYPVITLLGAIAGYLLGNIGRSSERE